MLGDGTMKPYQIFACDNTIGIYDKDEGKFVEGICLAMSAVWCRNMLGGKRDLLSKPDPALAGPLQAKYEIIHKNDYGSFLGSMGLRIVSARTMQGLPNMMGYLTKHNAQYMLRYPGHAMGAKIGDGAYYFFDPEEGLFKYGSASTFEAGVLNRYSSKFTKAWTIREVAS
jgi:hypothetical protein